MEPRHFEPATLAAMSLEMGTKEYSLVYFSFAANGRRVCSAAAADVVPATVEVAASGYRAVRPQKTPAIAIGH